MINWIKIRRDFPITKRFTYLDHASCGPMPMPVYRATLRYYDELGGFADFSWNQWIARREAVRRNVARFINAEPEEITFTSSTSHGMNLIAELIAKEGEVLTNTLEFPATTVPWIYRKAKMKFIEPVNGIISYAPHLYPNGTRYVTGQVRSKKKNIEPVPAVPGTVDSRIKTILTSYVQYQNGFRQDLHALGQMKGNRFLVVNATQGFGYLPIDVKRERIDFLATNCYKWLMAGYGGGIVYMNKKWIRKFKPSCAGWRSAPHPERFDNRHAPLKGEASRYEYGCPPFPHIFAIGAAIGYFSEIGLRNIEKRIYLLTDFLIAQLRRRGFKIISPLAPSVRSGIVVFYVANAERLTQRLLTRRIYVSARGGGIRVAPHFYNNEDDIMTLLSALKREIK
ncbi:MAG: aminotransferase class V-fold PLP-dependent enzyme [Candidatus Omnitrophica bacterium]|nr:aminotransferase class V-fold PLP-dependent enzyme [Candidatus Omnitrophota bacterium]